ncbi:STAS domain-containing protein [Herbaspirillum rhizosphaerae]|uniref:STAS domain-containing protein n=1 Tax=Herbaspirillum rhizosphaerae TaxID=346179 RepID=UPI00067C4E69|nr:STAS domain-containing protein [Herbaspirillum rhizosphaerae]
MKIEAIQSNEVLIVRAVGSLDVNGATEFAKQLQNQCRPELRKMILDFTHLDALGSAGLKVLYLLSKKAESRRARVVVVGLQPDVREVFDSSGFVALYKILGSVDEGLRLLDSAPGLLLC